MASLYHEFLDHTQRRAIVGKVPLDECLINQIIINIFKSIIKLNSLLLNTLNFIDFL
jgi:hypothetical protein